jgi:aspartyl-tRNA(Asn)/glutamyl-tRNA(Gln) amidotransferase subunit C
MALSIEEVEHIAMLARLELSQAEKKHYQEHLSAILEYAAKLSELDTSGILPTSSGLPAQSVLRDDEPRPGMEIDDLLLNAPQHEARQFRVPPVLGAE